MTSYCEFIGVHINQVSIHATRLNDQGNLLSSQRLQLSYPPMPGLITILLCDLIASIDSKHSAGFIGVCLSGQIDAEKRIVRNSYEMSGWIDVPLADWLEPRLGRNVVIGEAKKCKLLCNEWSHHLKGTENDVFLCSIGAARLAFKQFRNSSGPIKEKDFSMMNAFHE